MGENNSDVLICSRVSCPCLTRAVSRSGGEGSLEQTQALLGGRKRDIGLGMVSLPFLFFFFLFFPLFWVTTGWAGSAEQGPSSGKQDRGCSRRAAPIAQLMPGDIGLIPCPTRVGGTRVLQRGSPKPGPPPAPPRACAVTSHHLPPPTAPLKQLRARHDLHRGVDGEGLVKY